MFRKGSNSCVWGGYGLSYYVLCLSQLFFLPSSHPLHFPAPPPPPPCLTAALFLFPSANKLCMPAPTHGVVHCCTICSKFAPLSFPYFAPCVLVSPLLLLVSPSLALHLPSLPPFTRVHKQKLNSAATSRSTLHPLLSR